MRTNKEFYLSVGLNDIPWDRLVHWYGRSTDFPTYFYDILSDDPERQKAAIDKIGINIEHQDGIIMATPFALIFLFRLLSFDTTNKNQILDKILTVAKATKFQFEFYENKVTPTTIDNIQELLSEKYIWPIFESEDQDEINWEEYDYGDEQYSWLKYTFDIIRAFSFILTKFTDKTEVDIASEILATVDLRV
jgi:hypothetical protein